MKLLTILAICLFCQSARPYPLIVSQVKPPSTSQWVLNAVSERLELELRWLRTAVSQGKDLYSAPVGTFPNWVTLYFVGDRPYASWDWRSQSIAFEWGKK